MKALVEYKMDMFELPAVAVVEGLDFESILAQVCAERSLTEDQVKILSKEESIREITDFLALEFRSLVELGAKGEIDKVSLSMVNRWMGHLTEIVEQ